MQALCCHVPQMDRSDIEDDPEEEEMNSGGQREQGEKKSTINPNCLSQLDFYQADPFAHCQSDRMYPILNISFLIYFLYSYIF